MGSELRRPLGITIIGGLIFSQLLTLYTTPVIYLFFDGIAVRVARWRGRDEPPDGSPSGSPPHPAPTAPALHSP